MDELKWLAEHRRTLARALAEVDARIAALTGENESVIYTTGAGASLASVLLEESHATANHR